MVNNSKQAVLKNKDGEFVIIRTQSDGLKLLCTVDSQKEHLVSIETREKDHKNQVAFRFKHSDDHYYSPKVDGENQLKVNQIEITTVLPNSYWFEKVNFHDGAYYGLKSVDKPNQYVCVKGKKKFFCLQSTEVDSVQLKDEARGSSA